jgi:hypothetical protein
MAAYTFSTSNYPSVRAAIGDNVDEIALPDAVIHLPIYKGEAERYIMRNLTETQYETPEYVDEVNYAAILYLASLLLPTITRVKSERIAGGNITFDAPSVEDRAATLKQQADDRITDILQAIGVITESEDVPTFFGLAHRNRLPY